MLQTRDELPAKETDPVGRTTPVFVDKTGRRRHLGPGARRYPIFFDRTGRRRRLAVLAGAGTAVGLVAWLGLLLAGLFTDGPLPIPGWPDAGGRPRQDQASVERLERAKSSPTPFRTSTVRQPTAGPTGAPTVAVTPRVPPGRTVSPTDKPGAGDEHRSTPRPRPSKSTGKPA